MDRDSFPHLIIDELNAHRYASVSQGCLGFNKPGQPHDFAAAEPFTELIPRSQWHDLIKQGQGSFLSDLVAEQKIPAKMQGRLNICWCEGPVRAYELRRAVMGLPYEDLAPESVAGPATGWRNIGGYASEAFDQLARGGVCRSSFLDAPNSLESKEWKTGWQADAARHKAVQWARLTGENIFDQLITCLLKRIAVAACLPWWGHCVAYLDPIILPDGSVGVKGQNSWGVDWPTKGANGMFVLNERKATPSDAAVPILVSVTDN